MTAPDTLERIVEEMRDRILGLVPEFSVHPKQKEWAARIEALIPSKAEREFLEAATATFDSAEKLGLEDMRVAELFDQASIKYRALLAERGK